MLCDSVAGRLRAQGLYCGAVAVGLKDPGFRTVSRQKHLSRSTHLRGELLEAAMELIDKMWKPSSPVRLLSVTALALTDAVETYEQTDLFTPQQPVENARRERLELAVGRHPQAVWRRGHLLRRVGGAGGPWEET